MRRQSLQPILSIIPDDTAIITCSNTAGMGGLPAADAPPLSVPDLAALLLGPRRTIQSWNCDICLKIRKLQ